MQKSLDRSMHSANRAVSSGIQRDHGPVDIRRPSAGSRGAVILEPNLDGEQNASGLRNPRPRNHLPVLSPVLVDFEPFVNSGSAGNLDHYEGLDLIRPHLFKCRQHPDSGRELDLLIDPSEEM